jgi:hypothetical protein
MGACQGLRALRPSDRCKLIANTPRKDIRVFLNPNQMDNGATSPESGHHNWVREPALDASPCRPMFFTR